MSLAYEPAGRLEVDLAGTEDRFHRQTLISWWEQDRLTRARVLVVGAGALGNELVKNLALLGIGTVVVVDLDRVENSNLSRCVFFREEDEGSDKAPVVARGARAVNPYARFIAVRGDVRLSIGLGLFDAVDLVLAGLDSREARLHVNQACWKVGTPWVDGAIEGLMGVMRAFVPPDSACYECTMNDRDHELVAQRRACSLLTREDLLAGKVPTTATSASVVAAMQAQEAVKLLHADALDYVMAGRGVVFNGLSHDSYTVTYPRNEDCLSHDRYELADAASFPSDTPFRDLLAAARRDLGDGSVLDLEQDIALALRCESCGREERLRPLLELHAPDARCPACGKERAVEATHIVDAGQAALLELSPRNVGLPPFDVVTARRGLDRRHYRLVEGEGDPIKWLARHEG